MDATHNLQNRRLNLLPAKVLLVDDDPIFQESLRIILSQFPEEWVCFLAGNVREATAVMAAHQIDLAIVDVHLPDGTGADIIAAAGSVPCMLCTQDRQEPTFKKTFEDPFLQHNLVGFVTKPANSDSIWAIRIGLEIGREQKERNRMVAMATARMEEERRIIAQDLHDQMGSSLTQLTWIFRMLEKTIIKDSVISETVSDNLAAIIASGKEIVRVAHSETSRLIMELRPEIVSVVGLRCAIEYLVHQWEQTAPSVKFQCDLSHDTGDINENRSGLIYRLIQEGLTNTMRHTAPDSVSLVLVCRGTEVSLTLKSLGRIHEEKKNYVLASLRQRTASLGGLLQFNCDIKKGESVLKVTIPN